MEHLEVSSYGSSYTHSLIHLFNNHHVLGSNSNANDNKQQSLSSDRKPSTVRCIYCLEVGSYINQFIVINYIHQVSSLSKVAQLL